MHSKEKGLAFDSSNYYSTPLKYSKVLIARLELRDIGRKPSTSRLGCNYLLFYT